MKTFIFSLAVVTAFFLLGMPDAGLAGEDMKFWDYMCASCHNGKTAPSAVQLTEKYKTVEAFEKAVRHNGSRCMNILKNDRKLARKVAEELGLKENDAK